MPSSQPSMRKRQVIADSNKSMFMWIAGMSAIVGVCAVLAIFLVRQISFGTTVTDKLSDTESILKRNNDNVGTLVENVRLLEVNPALNSIKARPEDKALQVILDALPADNNSLALGASVQEKLVAPVPGLTIDSLVLEASADESTTDESDDNVIPFKLTVSAADVNILKEFLLKLERSIRVIDIDSLTLERTESRYTLALVAHAYYEPAKVVELKDEVVTPNEKK